LHTPTPPGHGYHEAFYYARLWDQVTWLGRKCLKHPVDLWVYQEILCRVRPDYIVECGTAYGGTALYLADVCNAIGRGTVISIDIAPQPDLPTHKRLRTITASSTDPATLGLVRSMINDGTALVILDSLHTKEHVLAELALWSPVVSVGSYLIVEDTNINGHPVHTDCAIERGPGPYEAVQEFLAITPCFTVDASCEKYLVTFNPGGFLRRDL
jgi:cephalosporin hydroxylase